MQYILMEFVVIIFRTTIDYAIIKAIIKSNLDLQPFVLVRYSKNGTLENHAKKSTPNDIWVIEIVAIPISKNQNGFKFLIDKFISFIFNCLNSLQN